MKGPSVIARILEGGAGMTLLLFFVVLAAMFHGVFVPDQTLFSNDGPLGELNAACHRLPDRFTGCWGDLSNVGFNSGAACPDISFGLQWLLGPVLFSKFYAVISLLILGFGAWCFFRQSGLAPLACVLGGLASILSSTYFSAACWGMGAHDITTGMFFLALAALAGPSSKWIWLRLILAGMAVGMGVAEGADMGVIFSMYVVVFVIYRAAVAEGSHIRNLALGAGQLALIAGFAVFLAAQPVYSLASTALKGVTGVQQGIETPSERWDWATQWSLPKQEMLGLAVPGLFGYRTDSPKGANYWGAVGREPAWEKYIETGEGPQPTGFLRFTGGGNYVGVLVLLLALWAGGQSFIRKESAFAAPQRRWLWFWLVVALVSLLLALGRYAPFYQWVYALPYFSTIRNPVKFLDMFGVAVVVLFAFGVDGLQRKYMALPEKSQASRWPGFGGWWSRAGRFEKNWVIGCGLALAASLGAWLVYSQHYEDLKQYLQNQHAMGNLDAVATFSIHQVGWFVMDLFLAIALLVLIFSRAFAGNRIGGLLLALLLIADLGLANQPWIIYWNYQNKYATNPVLDVLRDKPYEHRVVIAPMSGQPPKLAVLDQVYHKEWLQHEMPFYNIQSFDVIEMSRVPEDFSAFVNEVNGTNGAVDADTFRRMTRAWQLTNSRYLLAPFTFEGIWEQQPFLANSPLQKVMSFSIEPKPGVLTVTRPDQVTAVPVPDGRFGLFEIPDTLPRAKLYSQWQVDTDEPDVLHKIFDRAFDPNSSVYVAGGVPASPPAAASQATGAVDFVSYAPKDLVFNAKAVSPSVLLLNDHFDPNWRVWVDGKPENLLRCNFLMRGVFLQPGAHQVEFKFQPPVGMLYVSVAAVVVGLVALGMLLVLIYQNREPVRIPVAESAPAPAPAPAPVPAQSKSKRKGNVSKQPR